MPWSHSQSPRFPRRAKMRICTHAGAAPVRAESHPANKMHNDNASTANPSRALGAPAPDLRSQKPGQNASTGGGTKT